MQLIRCEKGGTGKMEDGNQTPNKKIIIKSEFGG